MSIRQGGITEDQRKARRTRIGSSDLSAICGVDPLASPQDVWAQKVYETDDWVPSKAARHGTDLEPAILDYAERNLGALTRNVFLMAPGGLPIGCHVDAVIDETGIPVEAKSTAIVTPTWLANTEEWGDEGSDQVPDRVNIQCHGHMLCTKRSWCKVAALIAGRGFVIFELALNADLLNLIIEKAKAFWLLVESRTKPDGAMPSLDILRRIHRQPSKTLDSFDLALIDQWTTAKERAKEAKGEAENAQSAVLTALGDAEAAKLSDGRMLTYFEQTRKQYTVKENTFRVARIKKAPN